jgi:hypothetical protein
MAGQPDFGVVSVAWLGYTTEPVVFICKEDWMFKTVMLALAVPLFLAAQSAPAPEIDPSSGVQALTLLAGVVLIMRARRRKV